MSIEQEKLNALNQALGKIEKEFGKRVAFLVGGHTEDKSKTWVKRKRKILIHISMAVQA